MTPPAPAQGYKPHSYVIDRQVYLIGESRMLAIEMWHGREGDPIRESSTTT
jgi:hypothetical protein